MDTVSLSLKDRLVLQNLYLILEKLYPAGGFAEKRKIVEEGYTYHYSDLFISLTNEEMSIEDSKFVIDVLEMYRGIIYSNRKLGTNSIKEAYFKGFDGNNESSLMCYAKFFVFDLNRYEEIQEISGDFNSHSPMRIQYEHMLKKWKALELDKRYSMTKSELEDLLNTY